MTNNPELWAGVECTLNRVGDMFTDQVRLNGHRDRIDDLDRFASLGIDAIRYPILWEHISPDDPDLCDWSWSDPRMARLKSLELRVIGGLVHHGSGPRYTSLLEDSFAPGLALHAARTAARYPWVTDWTPVNEPVTTARFSALYGLWYPHLKNERAFWLALLNQVDAIRLSMRAIRRVIPGARLIQTDDLGRTYATATLRGQAAFDNERRWAGWDLLFGIVDDLHPLWPRLSSFGLRGRLRRIVDDPCPPDVIGINHYLTSDRFLDHRLQRYPPHSHGGSDEQLYADVEALRVLDPAPPGLVNALNEAWARYRTPLAITEIHNGCTREEQLRWVAQAWDIAVNARSRGIDVEAVTLWSLLGSQGWNTLLTHKGLYEPGAWDVSNGSPRATALTRLPSALTTCSDRPLLSQGAGWWQRPIRIMHPPMTRPSPIAEHCAGQAVQPVPQPLLICGATGTLGQAVARACMHRNIPFVLTGRDEIDLGDPRTMDVALKRYRPWAVVNAAGWVRVDQAEYAEQACRLVNAGGAQALAAACADHGVPTLSFSSDLVFDGTKSGCYDETDTPLPLNAYGRSKADMEAGLLRLPGRHLIIRTAAFFSPYDHHNFAVLVVDALRHGEQFRAADDLFVTPTYVPHLVATALDLLIDEEVGLWHLTNGQPVTWADFARRVALSLHLEPALVVEAPSSAFNWAARRPVNGALSSSRGAHLPSLTAALEQFSAHMRAT